MEDDLVSKVHLYVKKNLGTNACNLEGVAERLDRRPRSLQRELMKQGFSFRQVLLDVRRDVAEHYLRSSKIALVDLADILGYRNVSAFSRAFKSSCGQSPEHWRRRYSQV